MNFLSELALRIEPYKAGEQPREADFIKLNTNENPYPPSPKTAEAIANLDAQKLRLYSDPENSELKTALAALYGCGTENVFVGNGSDEVLAMCFPAFFDPDGKGAAFADVTYSFYPVWCDLYGVPKRLIPLKNDYTVDFNAMLDADVQGFILANPNAPTGIAVSKGEVERFIASAKDKIVIADEAYSDFSGESVADSIFKYENLLVVKTFSKSYSLAGIRCGFALGQKNLIDGLSRIKNSFNSYTVNYMTEKTAAAAARDTVYYRKAAEKIAFTRDRTAEKLRKLGFGVLPSGANFLFVDCAQKYAEISKNAAFKDLADIKPKSSEKKISAGEYYYSELKKRGILVRWFDKPRTENFLRVSIGTESDMEVFLLEIEKIAQSVGF